MSKNKKQSVASLSGEDGWAKIFEAQGESLGLALDKQRAEAAQREKDIEESSELFHKLWGEAHDSPQYNKDNWNRLQTLLRKLGIPA